MLTIQAISWTLFLYYLILMANYYSYGKMLFCIFVYEESEKSDRLSNNIPKAK